MIIIISGRQGVGKTTIIQQILQKEPSFKLAVSATTRKKRINEYENEYYFLTEKEFEEKEKNQYFLEAISFNGFRYGTPKDEFIKNKIFNVTASSIQVFLKFLQGYTYQTIFIDAPTQIIKQRLVTRGENSEDILKKLHIGEEEQQFKHYFHHIINNDILEDTIEKIRRIIRN